MGEYHFARGFYARVTSALPGDATGWYNLATVERNLGNFAAAEKAAQRSLASDANFVQAALFRSHLRKQRSDQNNIDDLRERLNYAGRSVPAQVFLNYALGKELDDVGEYGDAFHHFSEGARVRRSVLQYDVAVDVSKLQRIRETFTRERLRKRADFPESCRYGFIIGLPRSGTTLLERVLTGHPDVATNGETDNLMNALLENAASQGADVFERAAMADPGRVGRSYVRRAGDASSNSLILEKLPMNYLYAGAIRRALPDSPIILVSRTPADNCFAMFSTLFGSGYPFSYSFEELARYYRAYTDLVEYWRGELGDQLLVVSYEHFVGNPKLQGARIAEHMRIPWNDSMAQVEKNASATATESAEQVRRPIYKSSIMRWRNYEPQLKGLFDSLSDLDINPTREA
jgi:tetratricopeptide (TPR) repeat protein